MDDLTIAVGSISSWPDVDLRRVYRLLVATRARTIEVIDDDLDAELAAFAAELHRRGL